MARYKLTYVFFYAFTSFCLCEVDLKTKTRLTNGFVDFYNSLPNEIYTSDEGFLENAQQTDISNAYDINISLKVSHIRNLEVTKYLKCTATIADLLDNGVAVLKHHCEDDSENLTKIEKKVETEVPVSTEIPFIRKPIQLDNEVQTDTAVTSGEQFIAIPREDSKVHCIGCSSHVNPQAEGVRELAGIGVRQLNSLDPDIHHTLNSVIDVERQVQVVNGVRYILTLLIDYNSCKTPETDTCLTSKACKITILEKPWMQLPDGSKYRAVLSNNCTEQWQFGDDGVVVPHSDNKENNNVSPTDPDGGSEILKAVHSIDVQSQQHTEKALTDQDVKKIEEQIIPFDDFVTKPTVPTYTTTLTHDTSDVSKEHVVKVELENQYRPNSIEMQTSKPQKVDSLDDDKKKTIDELMNFFSFAGFDSKSDHVARMKRSFDSDLNILNLVEKFQKVKKNMENAKQIYTLAQNVVDYLNENDLEVKDRLLKDVTNAEEESEDRYDFFYIQFRTVIPCKTNNCDKKVTSTKICNAIIDNSDNFPQILNVFCHDEDGKKHVGIKEAVPTNDIVLHRMIQESIRKIESESQNNNALHLNKVIDASIQRVSGTLTKVSIVLVTTNCEKSVPFNLRSNCSVVDDYGSQICDVTIHERDWLKEKSISYTCTDRPTDIRFSETSNKTEVKNNHDPKVLDMVQEALQNLEEKSNRNNKQIVIRINSVTTQLVAGFLTNIEFIVGYTTCPSYTTTERSSRCRLIENEPLRTCTAKVWDRTWMEDGRKVEVSCSEPNTENDLLLNRKKRSRMLGAPKEEDVNDPKYTALAKESLQKFMLSSGKQTHYNIIKIEHAWVQVVAGAKYIINFKISPTDCLIDDKGNPTSSDCKIVNSKNLTSCNSEIWEKAWLNEKDVKITCHVVDSTSRVKRQPSSVGGESEKNPNEQKYKKLAEESLQKFLQDTGNLKPHRVTKVDKVTVQVVAGKLTRINFTISPVAESHEEISCFSKIWERPWLNSKEITVNCHINNISGRMKRSIAAGGYGEEDTKNPIHKRLAKKSIHEYIHEVALSQPHEFLNIEKSMTMTQMIKSKKHRHTEAREMKDERKIGGVQEEDATKQEYIELAKDSLQKYQKTKKSAKGHVLVEVKKVTTKVVSGIIYNIDFTAAPKACAADLSLCNDENLLLNCHSVLWHRPWLLQKDINVKCKSKFKKNKRSANLEAAEESNKLNQLTEVQINDVDERGKRQAGADDDYIDEDTRFYYADRAIQKLNDQVRSSNLYKLITIHTTQNSMHMDTPMVRMFIEAAETYCLRHLDEKKPTDCEEMDGNNHRLCLVRVWPSPEDEMVIQEVSVICDDDEKFEGITGLSAAVLLKAAIKYLESSSDVKYKIVHQGEPQLIPSLDSNMPNKLNFIIRNTNCSKHMNKYDNDCFVDASKPAKACSAFFWIVPNSRTISKLTTSCSQTEFRQKRSVSMNPTNASADDLEIQKMVKESLEKLEMTSPERYKQKVLKINSYSSKVTSGKVTTIDFDVGFTTCLKYEWVDDIKTCEVIEHLPRRHCISEVWERLWLSNGRDISVQCEDEVVPLEAHLEFESASLAMALANRAVKHIEAKYPHPRKQKVVRIYSLDKQVVAGVHYRMKMEVGVTNCSALSGDDDNCEVSESNGGVNKFCRVNVWLRPWTDHPPNFRVSCDYQEGGMADLYHQLQAEHLFRDFLTTYKPEYINDHEEMQVRFEVFKSNIQRMHELNIHERGTATYGVTRFADLTYEEFTKKHMGLKTSLRDPNQVSLRNAQIPNVDIPTKFDWREQGAVTEVKDQGSCGSCWAFSVTGNIEGQWKLKSGKLVSLSEQELVDCDKMDDGCNGGLPDNAYRAIEEIGGLETETDYPYEGENDKCAFNKTLSRVQISGAVNITSNETEMAKWLFKNGPISIGINANAMQFYMGGVSHPWKMLCSPKSLDHGVLIVGYGIKNYPLFHKQLPYWIVKNSWGPSWGEKGYYRVFRGDGTCGVNQMASSAVVN